MSTLTGIILADFTTSLAGAMAVGATSATLQSATDDDGVALVTGTYYFTLDGSNSSKEHIRCTLTGTALTSIYSISRQGVATSGCARAHRLGATVTLTDFAHLLVINNLINGTTNLNASDPLEYDGAATINSNNQLATKLYVDGVATAGAPDASTVTKGITTMSVAPVSAATPIAVGDNDGRVPTQAENDALVGNNTDIAVGSGNKMVTQTGLQDAAEIYAASATGNDTYVITLSPVPTALHNGMTIRFKPDTANTGAATLNVNSLGALSIVTGLSTALVTGDILANQICEVVYNSTGTVWQLKNPASMVLTLPTFTNGETTKNAADSSTTQNIAHGLGKIPKKVRITAILSANNVSSDTTPMPYAMTVYNGTTQNSISYCPSSATTVNYTSQQLFWLNITHSGSADSQAGVVTFDSTNIIITWTKTNSPTGTFLLLWEAEA